MSSEEIFSRKCFLRSNSSHLSVGEVIEHAEITALDSISSICHAVGRGEFFIFMFISLGK